MKLSLLCLGAAALSVSALVPVKRDADLLKITPLEGNCQFQKIANRVTCIPVPDKGDPRCYKFKETPVGSSTTSDYCMWVDDKQPDGVAQINGPYIL